MCVHFPSILDCIVCGTGLSKGQRKRGNGTTDESTKSERFASRASRGIARDLKRESETRRTEIWERGRRATVRPRHVESRVLKDVCKNT